MEEVFTLAEAARYLKVNKATIYKRAQQGEIPAFKVGKIWRFKREEFEAWVDANRNKRSSKKIS